MNAMFRRHRAGRGCAVMFLVLLATSVGHAQEERRFASKGVAEVGGSISLQNSTPVSNGQTGTSLTLFAVQPYIGYFVADGFELGLNPLGLSTMSAGGSSVTQLMIMFAPSYNFQTGGKSYPFIEALLGYTSASSGGQSLGGFSWGGRGGVKVEVTEKGLLNLGFQYVMLNYSPSGASQRSGSNNLAVSAGFTLWF